MICAFTGHRPEKLPWGSRENDLRCAALKEQIVRGIAQAVSLGADGFSCGMARGCDFYFAEAVLAMGYSLDAYLPCPSQADRWPTGDQLRQKALLSRCRRVFLISPAYTPDCMTRRNRAMVDGAELLLSVWDGTPSGTGATVAYAKAMGKQVIGLWL